MPRRGHSLKYGAWAAALTALWTISGCEQAPTAAPSTAGTASGANELTLDGVELTDADSRFAAAHIVGRKRSGGGGFFVYHDLRELVLSDATLAIRSDSASFSITPLIHYAKEILSLIGRMSESAPGQSRSEVLSRLLFTDLAIQVEFPGSKSFRLSARKARLNLDSDSLVLEEQVELTPPTGKSIAAPVAVLAESHDGVYLPRGYWLGTPTETKCRVSAVYDPRLGELQELRKVCGGTPTYKSTFFVLGAKGALSAARAIPAIQYEDYIDSREKRVLSQLLEKLPSEWRPLLIGILSSQSPLTLKPPGRDQ